MTGEKYVQNIEARGGSNNGLDASSTTALASALTQHTLLTSLDIRWSERKA